MNHKDLEVWKEAMTLVEQVYTFVQALPKSEDYILSAQIRKTAISVPSNIAEGAARNSKNEFIQFCYIALASLSELETQILLANRIFQIPIESELARLSHVRKLIVGLINYLKRK